MRFNRLSLITNCLLLSFGILSCSNNNARTDFKELLLVGELKHTQYWNKNDNWDFKGLSVNIVYSDDTTENIPLTSNYIQYNYYPSKPIDGTDELVLKNIYYVTDDNEKHLVADEAKYSVTVIEYPYDYAEVSFKDLIGPVAILVISSGVAVAFLIGHFANKKKGKKSKDA